MIRTTLAPTVLRAGERDNVLPDIAEAKVNLRILPGDSVAASISRVEKIIASAVDGEVTVEKVEGSVFEPVLAGPIAGSSWDFLGKQVKNTWPDAVVAPYLMTATTDSRWYHNLSENIYRFIPMEVSGEESRAVHSANESISIAAWEKSIDFLSGMLGSLDYQE